VGIVAVNAPAVVNVYSEARLLEVKEAVFLK
jgi:hypothetical protein